MLGASAKRLILVATALASVGVTAALATPHARHWTVALMHRAAHQFVDIQPKPRVVAAAAIATVPAPTPVPEVPVVEQALDERLAGRSASQISSALDAVKPDGFIAMPRAVQDGGLLADSAMERAIFPAAPYSSFGVSAELGAEIANAHQAIALYRKGQIAQGDEFARTVSSPLLRVTLEWVAIRFDPREAGFARVAMFAATHPDWAAKPWLNRRLEELTLAINHDPVAVLARFATAKPLTLYGQLALARADMASGNPLEAAVIVRDVWRNADIDADEEATILKEFGSLIVRDDHKFRADRLLYQEKVQPALRAAGLAGPDVRLLALARTSIINSAGDKAIDAAVAAVPKSLANDPGLTFARIQRARRATRITEAADLMAATTQDPALLIDGDAWWVERRLIARKLLDSNDPHRAYTLCAGHSATSDASTLEAEFHAGWIALRFLNDPKTAATHFARLAERSGTPISRSRAAYWQGRAAEAAGDKDSAAKLYAEAANQVISFYGQLAADKIGRTTIDLHQPGSVTAGDERREAIRSVEQLYGLGERDIALPLALAVAKGETSDAQLAGLAAVLTQAGDAKATLLVGKLATQRGMALDETAFPTFGIPGYQPLAHSADRSVVYAIARQESEFDPKSVSSAGAKGLMQLIASTARMTAQKFGVAFDGNRLLSDAAYNAQIGAAHLGQLLADQQGSYILTFAAYNAGPGRVKEWIDAYGDPRKPGVDPVDWIERIPFTETRNYVQRVYENMQIYRARFGQPPVALVGSQLAQNGKGT